MTASDDDVLQRLLHVWIESGEDDVEAFCRAHPEGGDELHARIASLEFVRGGLGATTPSIETPPELVGPYRVVRKLGEGGMAVVYLAEQSTPVRRQVALKFIKIGMDTREVLDRFDAERQALALMEHPNIAQVFDAGTTESGRPYFAMEYVSGERITEFCDRHQLGIADRLRLFDDVCRGVQHAHHKGVIHRDIKPSNVLVYEVEGRSVPKIIDFGIAKAVDQRLAERTVHTQVGQFIGTPEYMSPEQAGGSGAAVDTRTDVYALGVLLYEILTGSRPLRSKDLRVDSYAALEQAIRDLDPDRPSTRVATVSGESEVVARSRGTTRTALARQLRSGLDWIVLRAMSKDPEQRYQTPIALAEDIERFLLDVPVVAGPPSQAYRLRKFMRRNRVPVIAAGSVLLLLLLLGPVFAWLAADAAEQAALAKQNELLAIAQRDAKHAMLVKMRGELFAVEVRRVLRKDPRLALRLGLAAAEIAPGSATGGALHDVVAVIAPVQNVREDWDPSFASDRSRVAFSPDGQRILLNHEPSRVRIVRAVDFTDDVTIAVPDVAVTCSTFSPDGRWVGVGTDNGEVRVFDATTGALEWTAVAGDSSCSSLAFNPSATILAVMRADDVGGSLSAWDCGSRARLFEKWALLPRPVEFDSTGRHLLWYTGRFAALDAQSGDVVGEFGSAAPRFGSFAGDGVHFIAFHEPAASVSLVNIEQPELVRQIHGGRPRAAAMTPDGELLVAMEERVRVLDVASLDTTHVLPNTYQTRSIEISQDGRTLLTIGVDHSILFWDLATGVELISIQVAGSIRFAQLSRDGSRAFVVSRDGGRTIERVVHRDPLPTALGLAGGAVSLTVHERRKYGVLSIDDEAEELLSTLIEQRLKAPEIVAQIEQMDGIDEEVRAAALAKCNARSGEQEGVGTNLEAYEQARAALADAPRDAKVLRLAGVAALRVYQYDEAIGWLASPQLRDDALAQTYLGVAYEFAGQPAESKAAINRALALRGDLDALERLNGLSPAAGEKPK